MAGRRQESEGEWSRGVKESGREGEGRRRVKEWQQGKRREESEGGHPPLP